MKRIGFFSFAMLVIGLNNISAQINIIPLPNEISKIATTQPFFVVDEYTSLYTTEEADEQFVERTEQLRSFLNQGTLYSFSNFKREKNVIIVKRDTSLAKFGKEAYSLKITGNQIEIGANDASAVFYAAQSLAQLLPAAFFSPDRYLKQKTEWEVDAGWQIVDYPRFGWRAFMLDESRHFFGENTVKQMIDLMALFKMNILHWHLTDDIGWRIEIKKYPRLTEIGAWRRDTQVYATNPDSMENKAHQGFYTQEQIKRIVKYAQDRNITIVPEIEMPGHATAAALAYPYLATDSTLLPKGGVNPKFVMDAIYDPSKETTYKFLSDVIDEVLSLFPSRTIHIGGDEVKFDQWRKSESVTQLMKRENLKTYSDVQMYFTSKISNIIAAKGAKVIGWNEILGFDVNNYDSQKNEASGAVQIPKSAIVQFWKGDLNLAEKAVENDYHVINSTHWLTYLDYTFESITMRKAYNFDPVFSGLAPEKQNLVLGFGTQMWTERVPTITKLHQQVFPRLIAYSEVGWTKRNNKDFESFLKRLTPVLEKLDAMQVDYTKCDYRLLKWGDMYLDKQLASWDAEKKSSKTISADIPLEMSKRVQNFEIIFLQTEGGMTQIEEVTINENGKPIRKSDVVTKSSLDMQNNLVHQFQFNRKSGKKYQVKAMVKAPSDEKSIGNIYLREF
ncbi:MAG: beta-N-acetylhexosaminidase [Prolixibacteraceae bacterium]